LFKEPKPKLIRMKKLSLMTAIGMLMMVASVALFSSCEGPAGAAGAAGANGADGADGADGVDANATCTQCHNASSVLVAKSAQYMNSQHAIGETTFENATSCAICHTSEGFQERMASGKGTTAAAIVDPTAIGCRTCHNIHSTYTVQDYSLRATAAVVMFADSTKTIDLGAGNACITCHQSRVISPNFVTGVNAHDSMFITNSRWGTHHGPQAEVVAGILGQGSAAATAIGHKSIANGCVTCHMAAAVGTVGGGHTFKVVFDQEGTETLNTAGCVSCHVKGGAYEMTLAKLQATQEEVQAKLTALEGAFIAKGWMYDVPESDPNHLLWKASTSKKLGVKKTEAAAMFNYKMAWEDKSLGVHNPPYVNGLLDEAMTTMNVSVAN
jgi:hypothetical protein